MNLHEALSSAHPRQVALGRAREHEALEFDKDSLLVEDSGIKLIRSKVR